MSAARRAIALMAVIVTLTAAFAVVGTVGFDDSEGSVEIVDGFRAESESEMTQMVLDEDGTELIEITAVIRSDGWVKFTYGPVLEDSRNYLAYTIGFKFGDNPLREGHSAMEGVNPALIENAGLQPTGEGYGYAEFYMAEDGVSADTPIGPVTRFDFTFTAQTIYNYTTTITYDANATGDYNLPPTTSREDSRTSASTMNVSLTASSTELTRDRYVHVGWNTKASGDGVHCDLGGSIDVRIGDDITLYAEWEIVSHTVSLYTTDDTTPWKQVSVQDGQVLSVGDPTPPEGQLFAGWYTDNTRSTPFDPTTAITADDALFAKFVDELEFTTTPTAKANVTSVESSGTFVFDSGASASAAKVLWEFPDGTTSTDRVTTHWFEPGTHTVKLTVWNSNGEMSETEFDVTVTDGNDNLPILWIAAGILAVAVIGIVIWRVAI